MKRIAIWLASTVTVVVLLFGYHTSTNQTSTAAPTRSVSSPSAPASSSASPSAISSASRSTTRSASPSKPTTYAGSVAETRWGPVQVQINVTAHKVTDVTVLQQPDGNSRDAEINDAALPILLQETLSAQSANIDMVSGATVTSDGYVRSLQAALDEAGI